MTALTCSFPNLEPVCCSMSGSNCCFCAANRFLRKQVRWSGILLLKNFPVCCDPQSQRQRQKSNLLHELINLFLVGSDGNAGDLGSIPGLGRSSGEGNDYPLQYYYLENSMNKGAWWATVHEVTES